ncbi:MAG: putative atp-dependent endonuclease of the old family [Parcubacteria group bacterium]|nr:putative atp-dependent endonuclease of the old family [Parcubacteria group bacterium]
MNIDKISIKNFRLLQDVSLSLEKATTLIVGRNNSGKTSLTELIRRLLSEKNVSFRLEDFSLCAHEEFWSAFTLLHEETTDEEVRKALPVIEVLMTVSYEKNSVDFGPLSNFIIDLNPDCTSAIIAISYQLGDGKVKNLFEGLEFDQSARGAFFLAMKERIPKLYSISLNAIDPNDITNTKELEWSKLHTLLNVGFINAQRGLDDETYKDKDILGKILEILFTTALAESADESDRKTAQDLEIAVKGVQHDIDLDFNENLRKLVPALSLFGYPGLADPGLLTETTLDVKRLLKDNTKIRYTGVNGISLPEAFNGLGARNLIFILLKLLEFFKTYKASADTPGIQVVFIEEPEAHLHPQMQEVFIRQLDAIAKVFAEKYNGGNPWPVQFVVSTHSSHIANEASFDATRYFISTPEEVSGKVFCKTRIKDLRVGLDGASVPDRNFLHQYMTLTKSDLLFADKAILIEGTSERLMLPKIIQHVDLSQAEDVKLGSQYITVVEVGGAYAQIFFELLNFLELRTLILTDIDSVKTESGADTAHKKACIVSEGEQSSNSCINNWFVDVESVPQLLSKTSDQKIVGIKRIAYQVPEAEGESCGRSFEGAFMLANPVLFGLEGKSIPEREAEVWDLTKGIRKTQFALKYGINETEWTAPLYIREGLQWLAGEPSGVPHATTVTVEETHDNHEQNIS